MTINSLQRIMQLEDELHRKEKAEQAKIKAWLNNQEDEIQRNYEEQLAVLEKNKKQSREKARVDAENKAAVILTSAKARAEKLDTLDDSTLKESLRRSLLHILGNAS